MGYPPPDVGGNADNNNNNNSPMLTPYLSAVLIPPGIALAKLNIRFKVEEVGHAGSPTKAIDNPGLRLVYVLTYVPLLLTTNADADTRWSVSVNVPWCASFMTAGLDAVPLDVHWNNMGVCCCVCCTDCPPSGLA